MRHFTAPARNGDSVTHAFMQFEVSMNAVQQAKRLAAAVTSRLRSDPAVVPVLSGRSQDGVLWSTPLSSAARGMVGRWICAALVRNKMHAARQTRPRQVAACNLESCECGGRSFMCVCVCVNAGVQCAPVSK
ncbi:guanin nucleotide-binding protein [Trypanosoma rangeli]|uniref:Guanin nucleotide-binding protein n=1 Tax=Trypanosoma rangeli TaxID=5698 RepID=A0A3S5IRJ4_TRYRA|nr:guanin nucleotide-binding protein [Trypanosoma rangeli]RNF07096.1 guanin nucleotide-binding protein [Trypanosoma rangeli]|eukprot:RNF07096.1 guanin nucleotide-binding protein [Trypanosoma rangeli]